MSSSFKVDSGSVFPTNSMSANDVIGSGQSTPQAPPLFLSAHDVPVPVEPSTAGKSKAVQWDVGESIQGPRETPVVKESPASREVQEAKAEVGAGTDAAQTRPARTTIGVRRSRPRLFEKAVGPGGEPRQPAGSANAGAPTQAENFSPTTQSPNSGTAGATEAARAAEASEPALSAHADPDDHLLFTALNPHDGHDGGEEQAELTAETFDQHIRNKQKDSQRERQDHIDSALRTAVGWLPDFFIDSANGLA